jgi:toxin secretion/phage lysis holin
MEEHITVTQMALVGVLSAVGAMWDKIGWLILLWAVTMILDYATGTLAALRNKEWNSDRAREGIWHKAGMLVVVIVAGLFDVAIKEITAAAGIVLPFDMLALPIILSWYTITELGSILENAIKMGADNVPDWLKKGLKIAGDTINQTGEGGFGKKEKGGKK